MGSVAYDTVETPEGSREQQLGGSATYFSVASSYFANVGVVAVVGDDFRDRDVQLMGAHGVDLRGLQTASGATFRWSGSYVDDLNSAQTLDTQLNVFENFQPALTEPHKQVPYLFLANIAPTLQHSVLEQMAERPRVVACDTMNLWIDTAKETLLDLIRKVDVVLLNEAEALSLAGERSLVAAAARLLDLGPNAAVIKRGEYGAVVFHRDFTFAAPAFPLSTVVDPTGAGDSFAGGFLGYLAAVDRGADTGDAEAIRRAAIVGSVMASFAVESFGVDRIHRLTREEIDDRFTGFVELTRFHPLGGGQGLPHV